MLTEAHKKAIKQNVVDKLRNGKTLQIVDKQRGYIHHFQINKKEKFICFERWVKCIGATSSDRWVNWNLYLSLKDVVNANTQLVEQNKLVGA